MADKDKVIEFVKKKTRESEERFFIKFSDTQMNAVLLIILSATFLVQGIVRYLEITDQVPLLRPWFILVLTALIFLVLSVVTLAVGGILSPLKVKRRTNMLSFLAFLIGFLLFLASLFFLLYSI